MTTKDTPWETIHQSQTDSVQRMAVEGGWLYRTCVGQQPNAAVAMVFVPSPVALASRIAGLLKEDADPMFAPPEGHA